MQTDQGETRQDCFKHSHLRESRTTIHTNYSPESGNRMIEKTDYEKYVEWCKGKELEPLSAAEQEKYGIWNSIVHLGFADDTTEELI